MSGLPFGELKLPAIAEQPELACCRPALCHQRPAVLQGCTAGQSRGWS